ncbi:MAG: hypothetical protein H0T62_09725 [Parachlamydiaceae bacterium]|nr:hypothetical protein [Parachlamydiaceae bacterium]
MNSVNYAHYRLQYVGSEDQFSSLYNDYATDHRLEINNEDKTVTFVRDLEVFEKISAFFQLLCELLCSCCRAENSEQLIANRDQAWEALKKGKWIRILEYEAQNDEPVNLTEMNLFSDIPSELYPLILKEFDIPLMGLCSQISKQWQAVFRQNKTLEANLSNYNYLRNGNHP